jgi:Uma2 family endonuclease
MFSPATPQALVAEQAKYVGRVEPLHFPVSAEVPASQLHLDLPTLLYQLLSEYLGEAHTVGSDQFVYWDASNPKRCVALDVYAKATPRSEPIQSWKVWERGAPDVAVEIVSDSDISEAAWEQKLADYQTLGVKEVVRLDLVSGQTALRVWNRTQEVLTERMLSVDDGLCSAPSLVFDFSWVVAPAGGFPRALRIATQTNPLLLVPTAKEGRETERQAKEAERQAKEVERQAKEAERQAKEAALARVRELEALLRSRE